ncbi:MAG: hypothetical protein MR924_07385 [Prevotella sp.]|nr:hypothetical protein [Prevotella sp.]
MKNGCANRMQSQACLSYAEVQPGIDEVNGCANRMQSQACLSYAEVQPSIDEVNGLRDNGLRDNGLRDNCRGCGCLWERGRLARGLSKKHMSLTPFNSLNSL